MNVAFVAKLSDKKLSQKLEPLQHLREIERIDLFRQTPCSGGKLRWIYMPSWISRSTLLSNLYRLVALVLLGSRYDLIVGCHQKYHGVFAALAGWLWGTPVIQLVISEVDWVYQRRMLRWAMMSSAACSVRGARAAERLRSLGYAGTIERVANPMPPAPDLAALPACQTTRDLLAVGYLVGIKDYPWMLEIVDRVRAVRPGIRLAIVGSGPLRGTLSAQISRMGLDEHVELLGWLEEPELTRAFRTSRALILTSKSEGLPQVVLEAMSLGLPVFVTAVGELPEVVRDGVEGRLCNHGDTEAMVTGLTEALGDEALFSRLGRAARARYEELAPEHELEPIAAVMRRLVSSAVGPTRCAASAGS